MILCIAGMQTKAQTITVPLSNGGEFDGGTILSVDVSDGSFQATPMSGKLGTHEENVSSGNFVPTATSGIHYESTNNSLYLTLKKGTRRVAANAPFGSIVRYDIGTGTTSLIKQMTENGVDGSSVFGQLVKVGSKLYGVTGSGGVYGYGTIFSIDPSDDSYQVVHSFNGTTDGGEPACQLFARGNTLYGAGKRGNGVRGELYYSFDVTSNTYTPLYINSSDTDVILTGLYERNNVLYISKGAGIHRLDLTNPSAGTVVHFSGLGSDVGVGAFPYEFTYRNGDGNWYVVFKNGGSQGKGSIGRINYGSPAVTNVHSFLGGSTGEGPITKMTDGLSGDIYGTALTSAGGNEYVLFKLSSIGVYSILHTFNSQDDGLEISAAPVLVGGKLYGISERHGSKDSGTIWSYDFTNGSFTVEEILGYESGKSPLNGLSLDPSTNTFGFSCFQGTDRRGTLNAFDPTNHSYQKVTNYNSSIVNQVFHKPFYHNGKTYVMVQLASGAVGTLNTLYAIYELDTSTGNVTGTPIPITPTTDPTQYENTSVQGNIIQDGDMLYGASIQHLWKVDLTAQTCSTLCTFNTSTEGRSPVTITKSGNAIHGVNDMGGANNQGTVFSFDLTNNTLTVVESTPTNIIYDGLVFKDSKLYTVKEDKTSGTTAIASLDLSLGATTFSDAVLFSPTANGHEAGPILSELDGVIYGVLNRGGTNDLGGLFSYDISAGLLSQVLSFDGTTGHYSYNSELLVTNNSLGIGDPLSSTTIKVFPNPSTDGVFNVNLSGPTEVTVYTSVGQKLLELQPTTNEIDLSELNRGLYVLKFHVEDKVYYKRVIRE